MSSMRKLLLLVSVPLALLAFSGPVVAQANAPHWYEWNEEGESKSKIGGEDEKSQFEADGTLFFNLSGGRVDCDGQLSGYLWNDEDGGKGEVSYTNFSHQSNPELDCLEWYNGCYADVTSNAHPEDSWKIALSEGKEGSIDFTLSNAFINGDFYALGGGPWWCDTINLTWGGEFAGTIAGGDVTYSKAKTTGAPNPATVDGNLTLNRFTAEMEEE